MRNSGNGEERRGARRGDAGWRIGSPAGKRECARVAHNTFPTMGGGESPPTISEGWRTLQRASPANSSSDRSVWALIQPLAWTTVEFFVVRAESRASKASRPAIARVGFF